MAKTHGTERLAALPMLYRSACTLAAIVLMTASARNTAPVFAWSAPTANLTLQAQPGISSASSITPALLPSETPSLAQTLMEQPSHKLKTFVRFERGLASWYGSVLQGHHTASGRIFDMNELTAAHRTLPFGSKVRVTDLRNNRTVVVTITDRGVLAEDRVIDLSYGAAEQLHMVRMGVDPVRLDLLKN
jgi:rare lipoprotein A